MFNISVGSCLYLPLAQLFDFYYSSPSVLVDDTASWTRDQEDCNNLSSVFQVLFSRFASPHVNIRLDSRPVSTSVALLGADQSEGALLMATGNKVGLKTQRWRTRMHLWSFLVISLAECEKVWEKLFCTVGMLRHSQNIILTNFLHKWEEDYKNTFTDSKLATAEQSQ